MIKQCVERAPAEGNRVVSLELMHIHLIPRLQCPACRKVGSMQLFQED